MKGYSSNKLNKWSKEEFDKAVTDSISISEALQILGTDPIGGNYRTFHAYTRLYNTDTSHFLGKSHLKGKKRNLTKVALDLLLVKDSLYSSKNLKQRLVDDGYLKYNCDLCSISEWKEQPISLHLDHINGDKFDNTLENLRLLCPNCHSQTDTYCGKNIKPGKRDLYIDCTCGRKMFYKSRICKLCSDTGRKSKIDWPSNTILLKHLETKSYLKLAKELGVSDNAIRNRLKKNNASPEL